LSPPLTSNYNNKIKGQIFATKHIEIFARVGSSYHLELKAQKYLKTLGDGKYKYEFTWFF